MRTLRNEYMAVSLDDDVAVVHFPDGTHAEIKYRNGRVVSEIEYLNSGTWAKVSEDVQCIKTSDGTYINNSTVGTQIFTASGKSLDIDPDGNVNKY